jgi:hypothetical protein
VVEVARKGRDGGIGIGPKSSHTVEGKRTGRLASPPYCRGCGQPAQPGA